MGRRVEGFDAIDNVVGDIGTGGRGVVTNDQSHDVRMNKSWLIETWKGASRFKRRTNKNVLEEQCFVGRVV